MQARQLQRSLPDLIEDLKVPVHISRMINQVLVQVSWNCQLRKHDNVCIRPLSRKNAVQNGIKVALKVPGGRVDLRQANLHASTSRLIPARRATRVIFLMSPSPPASGVLVSVVSLYTPAAPRPAGLSSGNSQADRLVTT